MPLRHVSDCELVGSQKSGLSYAIGVYNALRPVLRFGVAPGRSLCDASLLNVNLTKVDSERDRVLANDELRVLLPLLHAKRGQVRVFKFIGKQTVQSEPLDYSDAAFIWHKRMVLARLQTH